MNTAKKALLQLCKGIYIFLQYLSMLSLAIMVGSVLLSVFGRYILRSSPAWTEELAIICIVWLCMLTAQMGVYDGIHIRMTLIENLFPEKIYKTIYRFADIIPLIINVILVIFGYKITSSNGLNRLPSSGWPLLTEYLALIVSGAAGAVLALGKIITGGNTDG